MNYPQMFASERDGNVSYVRLVATTFNYHCHGYGNSRHRQSKT